MRWYNAFGQRLISTIYTQANQSSRGARAGYRGDADLAALENIRLTSSDGGIVPLTAIATVEQRFTLPSVEPTSISSPVTTISFNVPDNYSLGEAVEAILAAETQSLDFPTDIRTQFQGSSLAFQSALGSASSWRGGRRRCVAMCISCWGCCKRAFHPTRSRFSPPCPPPKVRALLALAAGGRAGCDWRSPSSASFC